MAKQGNIRKLTDNFDGPHKIIDKFNDNSFQLFNLSPDADKRYLYDTVNASRLKLYIEREEEAIEEPDCEQVEPVTGSKVNASGRPARIDQLSESTRFADRRSVASDRTIIYDAPNLEETGPTTSVEVPVQNPVLEPPSGQTSVRKSVRIAAKPRVSYRTLYKR